ncbi:amino acid permease [Mobilicoccus massiliensis]|uniref:amino acid permease n=1 Tax=Mobilicoccus massiliensis TaxID=1522310 RepID=UPI0005905620|nr:amino acid permease [Mobilicoccus massiliensis]
MSIFRTKSVETSIAHTDEPEHQLKKSLTAVDLTVFGIGVIIGAGIFTVAGTAAATLAGPSVTLSFVIAAICCGFAALCYAEFASTVPVAGSAYTFSYATLGEIVAWIIGWDLLLEMMLGASVVAQGWAAYASALLQTFGIELPAAIGSGKESHFDILAFGLIAVLTILVSVGIKESMRVNLVLVAIKLAIVLFVIIMGIQFINPANWSPFIPPAAQSTVEGGGDLLKTPLLQAITGSTGMVYGVGGVFAAAALVFFAYIGFDVVATTAEEAKNPQRDLPRGIIASLIICTFLYIAVSLVLTGMVHYDHLKTEAALAAAFTDRGAAWMGAVIAAGAVAGLTTVVMTLMIGATRVTFAMSRDNLLPGRLARINPKTGTPVLLTVLIGTTCALVSALTPIGELEKMVNIGTLTAFILVSLAVPVLRKRRPDLQRSFKVPLSPVMPVLSAVICFYLTLNLDIETWLRFIIWMALGFVIYFFYGHKHSRLHREPELTYFRH